MIPPKLKKGDEIRIVSPSMSMAVISKYIRSLAKKRLKGLGFKVTFSKYVEENDAFESSCIKSRLEDLHDAFGDKNVKGILTTIGGFNCNQLLKYLDYDLIKSNPKFFSGFSDTTALQNALFAKTGLVTYSGPAFSSFGMKKGFDYTMDYFKKCVMQNAPFKVLPSEKWSNDKWWEDQDNVKFEKNKGSFVINEGKAEGTIIGGNLCTLNILQGTEFMPSLKDSILFIEDDYESKARNFDRDLQSLIHLPDFKFVKGIVIGRFEKESKVSNNLLTQIIKTKEELKDIPVIANVDFGHTEPLITFPVGGRARINTSKIEINILEH